MASHVEVRFIDESDFLINGKGFILNDDADNLDVLLILRNNFDCK